MNRITYLPTLVGGTRVLAEEMPNGIAKGLLQAIERSGLSKPKFAETSSCWRLWRGVYVYSAVRELGIQVLLLARECSSVCSLSRKDTDLLWRDISNLCESFQTNLVEDGTSCTYKIIQLLPVLTARSVGGPNFIRLTLGEGELLHAYYHPSTGVSLIENSLMEDVLRDTDKGL